MQQAKAPKWWSDISKKKTPLGKLESLILKRDDGQKYVAYSSGVVRYFPNKTSGVVMHAVDFTEMLTEAMHISVQIFGNGWADREGDQLLLKEGADEGPVPTQPAAG